LFRRLNTPRHEAVLVEDGMVDLRRLTLGIRVDVQAPERLRGAFARVSLYGALTIAED